MRKSNVRFEKSDSNFSTEFALGYFYRGVKEELNAIAAGTGGTVPAHELAGRLAALLLAEESRSELGAEYHVLPVRRQTTQRSKAVAKVALARRPRGRKTSVKRSSGIKAYWARMTPDERKAESRRRVAKRLRTMGAIAA